MTFDMGLQGLLPETHQIIRDLEERSGFPVSFFEDHSLQLLATIRTGTPSNPVHIIRYRPGEQTPDYQIAFEAGYALRMFARPPEKRFHLSGNDQYRTQVVDEVRELNPDLDSATAESLGAQLFDGLLRQLRSCPTGLLVDLWIYRSYPSLRGLQAASLEAQAMENAQCLSKHIERSYPRIVVQGNRAMNAAHAFFIADLLDQSHLAVPYRSAGLEVIGRDLLSDVTTQPADEIDDQALIISWADRLGVSDWLKWLPFN